MGEEVTPFSAEFNGSLGMWTSYSAAETRDQGFDRATLEAIPRREERERGTPRTGAGNTALHGVGAGYGVHKIVSDPPHWSDDGH